MNENQPDLESAPATPVSRAQTLRRAGFSATSIRASEFVHSWAGPVCFSGLLRLASVVILLAAFLGNSAAQVVVDRRDFFVQSDPGVQIFVREVSSARSLSGTAILLIHGARVPGLASFDLPVPGGSLSADLAARGFDVYVLDVRGYGRSTLPPEMSEPPSAHPPLGRSARDIFAVVESIRRSRREARVILFGWATGGQWAGYYASAHPGRISALVFLNSRYRGNSHHDLIGHGSDLEDPAHPGRYNLSSCGASAPLGPQYSG
jgi:pimeloyl-ACP methyl ester carboxylesterase